MTLSLDDAKALVIDFCATYPVAASLGYKLRDTQEELYGPHATREAAGTILGAFYPRGRRAFFAISNFRDADHFKRTLRHEVLGHYGINTFNPAEKRAVLDGVIEARNDPGMASLWAEVLRLYPKASDSLKAEEVFAFACERIDPDVRVSLSEGARSFYETCIDRSRPMQVYDLNNITTMVAEGLHDRSRSQQTFPASDNAQFKQDTPMNTSEYPVWLAVPHEARATAREAAGLLPDGHSAIGWDKDAGLWFARPGADLDRVAQWLPDRSMRAGGGDPEAEFLDALIREGLVIQGMPVMDGQRHRVATVEDKKGKKSGVYRVFMDRRPGGWFINYHRAESEKSVTKWSATGGESDPLVRLHIRAAARQSQDDAARKRLQVYVQRTVAAKKLYDRLPAADPAHPYLVRKGIPPTPELRQTRNGALVVPFFNALGAFQTLQYIPPDGEKFLFEDAPKQGHFLVVGGVLIPGQPVLYAEGYATARSLNLATELPVVMTIDAGNMLAVAKVLHERFPDSPHVFLADFDHAKAQNKGLLMATMAAEQVGGQVLYPVFTDEEKARGLTDFNDLHQSRGLDALRAQILPSLPILPISQEGFSMANQIDVEVPAPQALDASPDAHPVTAELTDAAPAIAPPVEPQSEPDDEPNVPETKPLPAVLPVQAPEQEVPVASDDPVIVPRPSGEAEYGASPAGEDEMNHIWVGPPRPGDEPVEPQVSHIDKDALLARIDHVTQDDKTVLYTLDGEPAFVDHGNRLTMADGASQNDEKVMAALLTAAQYYRGRIELTGSEAFKAKAIGLIVQHHINVEMKTPVQRAMLEDARKALTSAPVVHDDIAGDTPPVFGPVTPVQPTDAMPEPVQRPSAPVFEVEKATLMSAPAAPLPEAKPEPVRGKPQPQGMAAHIHQPAETAKEGVIGKVMACGIEPYHFDDKNEPVTYITLRTKTGTQTFWGKELAGLLRETRVEPGKIVTLQWLGKEAVVVRVPKKNEEGVTTHFEEKNAHRNQWALTVVGGTTVRTGQDEGVKLAPYEAARFALIQQSVISRSGLELPLPKPPVDGLYWMTPQGQGSSKAGDELSARRPAIDPKKSAGQALISSWSQDGHLDMLLVRGDGPYLQGVVRQGGQFQHVLVSLPGTPDAPPMVFNAITPEGLVPIGTGNGINRSGGMPVAREHIAFKLEGDSTPRIGRLDTPAKVDPALHARLGFDERWKEDSALPKSAPTEAPAAQPSDPRPA